MKELPVAGQEAESVKTYSSDDVTAFANISGDKNPVHLDEDFAANSIFKQRIVHGMFVASQISELVAAKLPGPGSIYLNQTLSFKHPVYHGDVIRCVAKVVNVKEEKRIVELSTQCFNSSGTIVIDGTAIIKLL